MSNARLLIGSMSNDLFRVATLAQRGSSSATRFLQEAKRWANLLIHVPTTDYIQNIVKEIVAAETTSITEAQAEKYLMYGILLQNYALHM